MKKLTYRYHLKIEFDSPVTDHRFTVKCAPGTDERQIILSQNTSILPREFLCEGRDSFGNNYVYGNAAKPHRLFEVVTEGSAMTGLSNGTVAFEPYMLGMYAGQTDYTVPDSRIREFYNSMDFSGAAGSLEKSRVIMQELRNNFKYQKGVTDIYTTAAEAFSLGCGVCQDYAHIMLSLCRMSGILCRYVVGMLIGEGLSHAWVEIYDKCIWYGLDPTNGTDVFDDHIKISHGRDYNDCLINQGVFTGNAAQTQTVSVSVKEEENV